MPLPSGFEWIVILVIALLILGPGKLPDVASAVGKSIREFRKASSDVQEAVRVDTSPSAPATPAQSTPPPSVQPAPPTVAASTATAAPVTPPAPTVPTAEPVSVSGPQGESTTEPHG
jgi:TatA/E family protein of Tat protein translocase